MFNIYGNLEAVKLICKIFLTAIISIITLCKAEAQLQVTSQSNAQSLVQKLLGPGVTVSNVSLTAHPEMTGIFNNISGTNIGIDSGIVLTNGRAKTLGVGNYGVDGNGTTTAINVDAFNGWGYPGDQDLTDIVSEVTHDACVLEFDFVPLGDSIRFNYVFSSEEYTDFSCTQYNDAFAFFIRGPGIAGLKNLALIPGTSLPVTINNINEKACALYPQYFINNEQNKFFTHNGHIKVFVAKEKVVPCQTYHLKLVIADVFDDDLDSGVFLEAGSLSSNAISIQNFTQTDPQNNFYLVEGCTAGSFKVKRPNSESTPLDVSLSYAGTAINGVDMQVLPNLVTIPANQKEVTVNVVPIIDNTPEGIELIKIYALAGAGCGSNTPTDSTVIQIRDYDTLGIVPDTASICKNTSIQLVAYNGYTTYQWDPDPTLSSLIIRNPIATPVNPATTYYCTSTFGTCHGRDSAFIQWKKLNLVSKTEIYCKDAATGEIQVDVNNAWLAPVEYSINNSVWQPGNIFTGLPVGVYRIKVRDATGCMDSLDVSITQLYPDFLISNIQTQAASCSGSPDGMITINLAGGKNPYQYSLDGITFQSNNVFYVTAGTYSVFVKDDNNCAAFQSSIVIPLNNTVSLEAGTDKTICEGKSVQLNTVSNANSFAWWPTLALDNALLQNPVANPAGTIKYYVTATTGICNRVDSVTVFVNPAPVPNAGPDSTICFGRNIQLRGSGGVSYFWTPASSLNNNRLQNPTTVSLPGNITYSLHVVDANGCNSLKKDEVLITVTKQAVVDAGRDTVLGIGQPIQLHANDLNFVGFTQYNWTPAYGLNNPQIANPLVNLDRDITYTIEARTAIGCLATDQVTIKVYRGPDIYVPNAFTPNGNALNDVLRAFPVGITEFRYFRIYDRWGSLVFSTTNPAIGWDGRIKGSAQPVSTFVWVAEGVAYTGKLIQRKGTVTLIK